MYYKHDQFVSCESLTARHLGVQKSHMVMFKRPPPILVAYLIRIFGNHAGAPDVSVSEEQALALVTQHLCKVHRSRALVGSSDARMPMCRGALELIRGPVFNLHWAVSES